MTQVRKHQNLIDVAIQHCGDAAAAIRIAAANGLSLTDDLQPGSDIETGEVVKADVVKKLSRYGNVPATAYNINLPLAEGIGHWIIGQDFVVQ